MHPPPMTQQPMVERLARSLATGVRPTAQCLKAPLRSRRMQQVGPGTVCTVGMLKVAH